VAQRPHTKRDTPSPDDEPEGRGRKPFLLRLPKELHDEVRTWADEELRSLNGHIEYLLREAVRQRRRRK